MPPDEIENQSKREQNKARNRAVILDAARAVFVEIGYDAATIRDIVARTDLAPGTFYNYFPDKQSVFSALISEAAAEGSRRIREARARATSLQELAYHGYRAYFEFIVHDPVMFELLRRNVSTLRSLGLDTTGFAQGVQDLRVDLEREIAAGRLPAIGMEYLPQIIAAIAFEVGATMAQQDPPDVEGATRVAAELCLGGVERLLRLRAAPERKASSPAPRGAAKTKKNPR